MKKTKLLFLFVGRSPSPLQKDAVMSQCLVEDFFQHAQYRFRASFNKCHLGGSLHKIIHTPRNLGKKHLREIEVGQKPSIKTPTQEKLST